MAFTFLGKQVDNINFNGTPLNKLLFRGVTVWEKSQPTPPTDLYVVADTTNWPRTSGGGYYCETPVHGILIRTDYKRTGVYRGGDCYFATSIENAKSDSGIVPRMSLYYINGTYTDTSFTDRYIDTLPTMTIGDYTYYYYRFENLSRDYYAYIRSDHATEIALSDYKKYVLFFAKNS